jgi:microcystin-dependent protein
MATTAVTNAGSSQVHNNLQPYTTLHYAISLAGVFPMPKPQQDAP